MHVSSDRTGDDGNIRPQLWKRLEQKRKRCSCFFSRHVDAAMDDLEPMLEVQVFGDALCIMAYEIVEMTGLMLLGFQRKRSNGAETHFDVGHAVAFDKLRQPLRESYIRLLVRLVRMHEIPKQIFDEPRDALRHFTP
jgi:hypothetical protein